MSDEELREAIGDYDAILIRSATKLTAELIERADEPQGDRPRRHRRRQRRHPGRDQARDRRRQRARVELGRRRRAHAGAAAGALPQRPPGPREPRRRAAGTASKFKGAELYGKTLGVIGFGRIGQLVAQRAQGFEMDVVAFDKFVSAERFRELGVEGAESLERALARADFITLHVPKTPETIGLIDAEAIAAMKDGVRVVNCARGELVDLDAACWPALESGKVGGAALDVFPSEPFTEHPIFARDDVVVTPHLGASTAEARTAPATVTAEQVIAALTGGVVTNAVNIAAGRRRGDGGAGAVRAALRKARPPGPGARRGRRSTASRPSSAAASPSTTPACSASRSCSASSRATPRSRSTWSTRPQMAEERGIELVETNRTSARDFTELVTRHDRRRATSARGRRHDVGPRNRPTCSRRGARASTCRSPSTSRSSATPTGRA